MISWYVSLLRFFLKVDGFEILRLQQIGASGLLRLFTEVCTALKSDRRDLACSTAFLGFSQERVGHWEPKGCTDSIATDVDSSCSSTRSLMASIRH